MSSIADQPAVASQSLAGTTEGFRRLLLQFGSGKGCSATADHWKGPICGAPAPWHVACEDSRAGVTTNGVFAPARVEVVLCTAHLEQVQAEPRTVFGVFERLDPDKPSAPIAFIDLSDVEDFLS